MGSRLDTGHKVCLPIRAWECARARVICYVCSRVIRHVCVRSSHGVYVLLESVIKGMGARVRVFHPECTDCVRLEMRKKPKSLELMVSQS